jgi:hypothetical protein
VEGFRVLYAPWRQTDVAMGELDLIRSVRAHADSTIAPRMMGVLQTTWGSAAEFIKAYYGEAQGNTPPGSGSGAKESAEAAYTFKALFNTIRAMP